MTCVLLNANNEPQRFHDFTADEVPELTPEKGLRWERYAATNPPEYDPVTQGVRAAPLIEVQSLWTQQWEIYPLPAEDVAANQAAAIQAAREAAKAARAQAVDAIQVTTSSGKVFDGHEAAQINLMSAVQVAAITGLTETQWTLADNSRVTVTIDEIKEALTLAALEKSRLWAI